MFKNLVFCLLNSCWPCSPRAPEPASSRVGGRVCESRCEFAKTFRRRYSSRHPLASRSLKAAPLSRVARKPFMRSVGLRSRPERRSPLVFSVAARKPNPQTSSERPPPRNLETPEETRPVARISKPQTNLGSRSYSRRHSGCERVLIQSCQGESVEAALQHKDSARSGEPPELPQYPGESRRAILKWDLQSGRTQ